MSENNNLVHPGYFIPEGHLIAEDGNTITFAGSIVSDTQSKKDGGFFWESIKEMFAHFSGPQPVKLSKTLDKEKFVSAAILFANKNQSFLPEALRRLKEDETWSLEEIKLSKEGGYGEEKKIGQSEKSQRGLAGGESRQEIGDMKETLAEKDIRIAELEKMCRSKEEKITELEKRPKEETMPVWAQGMLINIINIIISLL